MSSIHKSHRAKRLEVGDADRPVAGRMPMTARNGGVARKNRHTLSWMTTCLTAAAALVLTSPVWPQGGSPAAPAATKGKATAKAVAPTRPAPAAAGQRMFATPQDAKDALVDAAKAKDHSALDAIFGPDHAKLQSGDAVQDAEHLDRFSMHIQEACSLEKVSEGKYTLFIGNRHFPFPIPIVKDGDKWRFDTAAGVEEILNRRIGEDELSAIMVCRVYALAQWEFFTYSGDHNEDGLAEYAEKFMSTPGRHDGLYWDTGPDADPSPLGLLVAEARAEGYGPGKPGGTAQVKPVKDSSTTAAKPNSESHSPYHGYYFKILTRQGASAPGGAFSYIINGHMIAGFALVAYPDKWGNSGVMSFIVNTQGRVYEKNLGAKTAEVVAAMKEYNPDPSWKLAPRY